MVDDKPEEEDPLKQGNDKETPEPSPIEIRVSILAQEEQQTIAALDQVELTLTKLTQQKQLLINQLAGIQRAKKELLDLIPTTSPKLPTTP